MKDASRFWLFFWLIFDRSVWLFCEFGFKVGRPEGGQKHWKISCQLFRHAFSTISFHSTGTHVNSISWTKGPEHMISYGTVAHIGPQAYELIWNLCPYEPQSTWIHMGSEPTCVQNHTHSYGMRAQIGPKPNKIIWNLNSYEPKNIWIFWNLGPCCP